MLVLLGVIVDHLTWVVLEHDSRGNTSHALSIGLSRGSRILWLVSARLPLVVTLDGSSLSEVGILVTQLVRLRILVAIVLLLD